MLSSEVIQQTVVTATARGERVTDEDLMERPCPKCQGLVVREMWRGEVGERLWGVRCVNCGKRGERGHWYGEGERVETADIFNGERR